MTGFVDLIPTAQTVKIAGVDIKISPLTAEQIGALLARFDKLREQVAGAASDSMSILAAVAKAGPDAISAIIAAGTAEKEDDAKKLSFGVQIDLIDAIIKATLPSGDGPLAKLLKEAGGLFSSAAPNPAPAKTPPTISSSPPPPSSG